MSRHRYRKVGSKSTYVAQQQRREKISNSTHFPNNKEDRRSQTALISPTTKKTEGPKQHSFPQQQRRQKVPNSTHFPNNKEDRKSQTALISPTTISGWFL
jgi:hypothetical protein